jgi:hypothetical protein
MSFDSVNVSSARSLAALIVGNFFGGIEFFGGKAFQHQLLDGHRLPV